MMRPSIFRVLAGMVAVCAAIFLVSCSSDSNPTGPGGGGTGNTINISGNSFTPASKTVTAGTTIKWVNKDNVNHTVTSDDGGFASSGTLGHNATYEVTFTTAGTFPYHCTFHPSMTATITVTP